MKPYLAATILIVWKQLGLNVERINESEKSLEIYISVPEHSYRFNSKGEEMSGDVLARRFKTAMQEMGVKRLTVKSRTRIGEFWTEEMGKQTGIDTRKGLYKN